MSDTIDPRTLSVDVGPSSGSPDRPAAHSPPGLRELGRLLARAADADAFVFVRVRSVDGGDEVIAHCIPFEEGAHSRLVADHLNRTIGEPCPGLEYATASVRQREHFHEGLDTSHDVGLVLRSPSLQTAGLREAARLIVADGTTLYGLVLVLRNRPFGRADLAGLDHTVNACHQLIAAAEADDPLPENRGELILVDNRVSHCSPTGRPWLERDDLRDAIDALYANQETLARLRRRSGRPADGFRTELPDGGAPAGGFFAPREAETDDDVDDVDDISTNGATALRDGNGVAVSELALPLMRPNGSGLGGTTSALEGRALLTVVEMDGDNGTSLLVSVAAAGHVVERIRLTPRQRDLAGVLMRGLTLPAAASELGVSVETVREHVKILHARLGVRRRVDLVAALKRLV